jgi:hypothetical protein
MAIVSVTTQIQPVYGVKPSFGGRKFLLFYATFSDLAAVVGSTTGWDCQL